MRITCSHCGQAIELKNAQSYQELHCPICNEPVTLPTAKPIMKIPHRKGTSRLAPASGGTAPRPPQRGGIGKLLFLLLLLAACGFGYFMLRCNESPQQVWQRIENFALALVRPAPTPIPTATPTPTPTATLTATPSATPVPTATPTLAPPLTPEATPDPITFLLAHPESLPKEITLLAPTKIELVVDGKQSGSITGKPGVILSVQSLEPGYVHVVLGAASGKVPIASTDLSSRAPAAIRIYLTRLDTKARLAALRETEQKASPAAGTVMPLSTTGAFIHPGGIHTKADLDRMKQKVAAGEHPWIDGWNLLIKDSRAQSNYRDAANPNMGDGGSGRQRSSSDAHAAYLNFIRWYVTGDRQYADCAIRICNDWSAVVNQDPPGGLSGIPISEFAMVGELLRCCPYWKTQDQERFKEMMRKYLYPHVKAYLDEHNRTGDSTAWANWDICNIAAVISIGVLLDDRQIFNEGIEYFKHGRGTGSIQNAVYFIHPDGLGQWQESGRDQGHAQLGVGMMAQLCQVAWNQGVDLFGYDDNRLLKGTEYVAATGLLEKLPFKFYDNDARAMNYWISNNGYGRMSSPVWELLYNHYVVRMKLAAPSLSSVAKLCRPENGGGDHFGYGTLTFTLDAKASSYPGMPLPSAPEGLIAHPGLVRVDLEWKNPSGHDASGYIVRRAQADGGSYETIAQWEKNDANRYTDVTAQPGVAYRYVVAAVNPAGTGPDSEPVTVKAEAPGPLPRGWTALFIGDKKNHATNEIEAAYTEIGSRSFRIKGVGSTDLEAEEDSITFAGCKVQGDCELIGRLVVSPQENFPQNYAPKMGLMIRESLAPGARSASVALGDVGLRGTRARFRAEPKGKVAVKQGNDYSWMPIWYKLERKGNTITAWHSIDGTNWFEVGSSKISLPSNCLIGFFVTGDEKSKTNSVEAIFDNTSLKGNVFQK